MTREQILDGIGVAAILLGGAAALWLGFAALGTLAVMGR